MAETPTPETLSPQQLTNIGDQARAARGRGDPRWGWTLGDAALRIAPWHIRRAEAIQLLGPLAVEIGVGATTLDTYRRVAHAWTPEERNLPNTAFAVFQILYGCKHLIRAGMHTPEAIRLAQKFRHDARTRRAAEAVARLARDHDMIVTPIQPEHEEDETDTAERLKRLIVETERMASPVPPPPPSPAPADKPLSERVLEVAWRIEQAMVEDGPDQEVTILADAIVDVLADMEQVAKVAEQLRSRVRWASTRKEG